MPAYVFASLASVASSVPRSRMPVSTNNPFDCLALDDDTSIHYRKKVSKKVSKKVHNNEVNDTTPKKPAIPKIEVKFSEVQCDGWTPFPSKISYDDIEKYITYQNFKKMIDEIVSKIDPHKMSKVYCEWGEIYYVNDEDYKKYGLKSFKPFSELPEYILDDDLRILWGCHSKFTTRPLRSVIYEDLCNRESEICGFNVHEISDLYEFTIVRGDEYDGGYGPGYDYYINSHRIDLGEYEDPTTLKPVMKKTPKCKAMEYLHSFYPLF